MVNGWDFISSQQRKKRETWWSTSSLNSPSEILSLDSSRDDFRCVKGACFVSPSCAVFLRDEISEREGWYSCFPLSLISLIHPKELDSGPTDEERPREWEHSSKFEESAPEKILSSADEMVHVYVCMCCLRIWRTCVFGSLRFYRFEWDAHEDWTDKHIFGDVLFRVSLSRRKNDWKWVLCRAEICPPLSYSFIFSYSSELGDISFFHRKWRRHTFSYEDDLSFPPLHDDDEQLIRIHSFLWMNGWFPIEKRLRVHTICTMECGYVIEGGWWWIPPSIWSHGLTHREIWVGGTVWRADISTSPRSKQEEKTPESSRCVFLFRFD